MKVPYSWLAEWVDVPWDGARAGLAPDHGRLRARGARAGGAAVHAGRRRRDRLGRAAPASRQAAGVPRLDGAGRRASADRLWCAQRARGAEDRAGHGRREACPATWRSRRRSCAASSRTGMLCSAKELGLAETSSRHLELPGGCAAGPPLREYLELDDFVLELNVTPNRGDAMSMLGIAREVAALTGKKLTSARRRRQRTHRGRRHCDRARAPSCRRRTSIRTASRDRSCDSTPGCMPDLRGLRHSRRRQPGRHAPVLRERLRRAGVRSISPVVDVTNYVMLELGQPMHAYDLAKLQGEIRVAWRARASRSRCSTARRSRPRPDVLLITDEEGPVGLAGIMGGERTAVSAETTDVFFEVAYFSPAGHRRPRAPLGLADRCRPTLRARRRSDTAAACDGAGAGAVAVDRRRHAGSGQCYAVGGAPAEARTGAAAPLATRAPARVSIRGRSRHEHAGSPADAASCRHRKVGWPRRPRIASISRSRPI